jgi:hypothetical protein
MVILRANQDFMRASRCKYPVAIKKLGHLFGQPAVDLHNLEGDASSKKRARRNEKNGPAQKQAKLAFASLANDAAKPQQ